MTLQPLLRFKSCNVEGCRKNAHWEANGAKGFCRPHYRRFLRNGDPTVGKTMDGELLRFIEEVALHHSGDDCLTWPYMKNQFGRPQFWLDGKNAHVCRYICEITHGKPPTPSHEAAHSCGKGHLACVSPHHLSWKTAKENAADRVAHGTHSRGERNGASKLTDAQRVEIVNLRGVPGVQAKRDIAADFGVSLATIYSIQANPAFRALYKQSQESRP